MLDLVRLSPEVLVLPLLGLGFWLGSRPYDVRPAVLTVVLLVASLVSAAKVGADLYYFLGLRNVSALAAGTSGRRVRHLHSVRTSTGPIDGPGRDHGAGDRRVPAEPPDGEPPGQLRLAPCDALLRAERSECRLRPFREAMTLAADPRVHLLTDMGLIDLYQGDRAVAGDPWLFRKLVDLGRIEPAAILDRIELNRTIQSSHAMILTRTGYARNTFGLPQVLVGKIRARYVLARVEPGIFYYVPRRGKGGGD